ncbi:MAG: SNF2-related protein, partial [Burkholderiales bacterium]|nr:SNF2-related protein [Burkholderiales bacterium]
IDSNPFLIFELHGVDLIKELENRGIEIGEATQPEIPTWSDLLEASDLPNVYFDLEDEDEPEEVEEGEVIAVESSGETDNYSEGDESMLGQLTRLSYQSVDFDSDAMLALLEDRPAGFIHGNLRDQLANFLKFSSKLATQQLTNLSERTPPTWDSSEVFLDITELGWARPAPSMKWKEFNPDTGRLEEISISGKRSAGRKVELFEIFSGYSNAKRLAESPADLEALFYIWVVATKFVAASAVEPLLFEPKPGYIRIQWFPSVRSEELLKLVEQVGKLALCLSPDFLRIEGPLDIPPLVVGQVLIGAIIESYMAGTFDVIEEKKPYQSLEEQILFGPFAADTSLDPKLEGVKLRLTEWLSPLSRPTKDIKPVLTIVDPNEEKAEGVEEAFERPVYLDLSFHLESPITTKDGKVRRELVTLNQVLKRRKWSSSKFAVMQLTARLSRYCEDLNALLRSQGNNVSITMEQLTPLMFQALPALRLLGVRVVLPRSLRYLLQPQLQLDVETEEQPEKQSFFELMSLLRFNWRLAVGDEEITPQEFYELAKKAGKIVRFHDRFIYVDAAQIQKIQRKLDGKDLNITKNGMVRAILTGKVDEFKVHLSEELKKALAALLASPDITVPESLNAVLRPYQEKGYSWLMRNFKIGLGSILADDMGLGKTVQVISFLDALRSEGGLDKEPSLIVIPKTLIENWKKEIRRFAPEIKFGLFYGSSRSTDMEGLHVVITTYGTLRASIDALKKKSFSVLILDEAQTIKNYTTAISKAVKQIKRRACIAMSGTPVENRLTEYWSIMDATNPGVLGTVKQFQDNFSKPIEVAHDKEVVAQFRNLTAPFIMRRLKTDKSIISDLPEKISINEYCSLTAEQAALYKARVDRDLAEILKEDDPTKKRYMVLQLILNLKQICNSPVLYEKTSSFNKPEDSGKMQRVLEILEEMKEAGRKVILFTQYKVMGDIIQKWLEEKTGKRPAFIHGGTTHRQEIVDEFQSDRSQQVLILCLRAAGLGLNIQGASAVIHYDLWWNPAVEDQATDRAYRIGQTRDVNVYRMISADTFEDKINELIESKRKLANMTVNVGETWIGDLSDDDLKEIFTLSAS